MTREGFRGITIDEGLRKEIDKIAEKEMCKNAPEVIRLLIRMYRKAEEIKSKYQ